MVPITVVTGFLESGKTATIMNILKGGYANLTGTTLIIDIEEDGEVSYDQNFLKRHNIILYKLDEVSDFNGELLQDFEDAYKPNQIFIEYNGVFKLRLLDEIDLPKGWVIERQMTVVDASCFSLYMRNLKPMFLDMVQKSSVVIFNRCTENAPLQEYKKLVESSNRQGVIVFENDKGQVIT